MLENIDFVICPICQEHVKRICTSGHLKKHKMTREEFIKLYPNQPLCCENYSKKLSLWQIGKIINEETKRKISESNKGQIAWNKGLTKETDERIEKYGKSVSKTRKEKLRTGEMILFNLGKKRSKESRLKMSLSHIGKKSRKKGVSLDELLGLERSLEVKEKLRIIRVNQIVKNGNKYPSYNVKTIPFFEKFDNLIGFKGIYATNPYEFFIKEVGFWVDYINFDLKIIIEIDEKFHYNKNGILRENDIIRQSKIQKIYPNFKFIRIKEEDMFFMLDEFL